MGDTDDPDLTELSPASDTETRSDRAWAFDDGDEVSTQRLSPGRITAGAVAASAVVIVAAAVIALLNLRSDSEPEPVAEPSTASSAAPAPRADLLNGVYRMDYHFADSTYRDTGKDDGGAMEWTVPEDDRPPFDWLMLSSTCTDLTCIATGEVLNPDRTRAAGARTIAMELRNGTWEEITPPRTKSVCTHTDDGSVSGESSAVIAMAFTPRPDGTFSGTQTMTVETNECGDQGNTVVTPLTLSRVGDSI